LTSIRAIYLKWLRKVIPQMLMRLLPGLPGASIEQKIAYFLFFLFLLKQTISYIIIRVINYNNTQSYPHFLLITLV
jgi:hypothetical protein